MKSIAIACATCVTLTGGAAAQEGGASEGLERGSTGIGSRISLFLLGQSSFRSGIEVGYAKTGHVEERAGFGGRVLGSGFQVRTSSTRLWHATIVARRQWPALNRQINVYVVGGTGVYMDRTSTERFLYDADSRALGREMTAGHTSWEFGSNVGAGIELKRPGWPGAIDIDARLHVLPFSSLSGPRTLMTFSAGLNFF